MREKCPAVNRHADDTGTWSTRLGPGRIVRPLAISVCTYTGGVVQDHRYLAAACAVPDDLVWCWCTQRARWQWQLVTP